jgi:hypothetical protein
MKKRISLAAVAFFTVCFAMAQTKKEKVQPPPAPSVEAIEAPPPLAKAPEAPVPPVSVEMPDDYQDFLSRNPSVKSIARTKSNVVHIYLKSGAEEVFDLDKIEEGEKLTAKYGKLPTAPPPPPPAPPAAPKAPKDPKKLSEKMPS